MAISTAAAFLGSAAISGGAALLSGRSQSRAAGQAAGLQAEATRTSVEELRRQFDLSRADLAPYRETGVNALSQYAALYGIGRGTPGTVGGDSPVSPTAAAPVVQIGPRVREALGFAFVIDPSRPVTKDVVATALRERQEALEVKNRGGSTIGEDPRRFTDSFISILQRQLTAFEQAPSTAAAPAPTPSGGGAFLSREEMQAARDRFLETPGYQFRFDEGMRF